jgi:hypothetical protein
MITVSAPNAPNVPAPQVVPYAPSTQPIAFVQISSQRTSGSSRFALIVSLLNAAKEPVSFDRGAIRKMTAGEVTTWLTEAATAGDSFDHDVERRSLPYILSAYGLNGFLT